MNNSLFAKPGVHLLILMAAIACFAFFQFCYPYHLFYQEQNQLFLFSWDYIFTYLDKPGWLACLTGDFLTQFYYYRFAGATILTLTILLAGFNVRCAMEVADVKGTWVPYTTAIAVMGVLACLSFHYDYRLSSILAIAGGASTFRVSTKILTKVRMLIKNIEKLEEKHTTLQGIGIAHWIASFSIFISIFVTHWFFGCGVWVYAVLVLIGCLMHIWEAGNYFRLATLVAF